MEFGVTQGCRPACPLSRQGDRPDGRDAAVGESDTILPMLDRWAELIRWVA
jgi:hypothetical protein